MSEKYNDEKIKNILEEGKIPDELSPKSIKVMLDKFGQEKKRKNKIRFNALKFGSVAAAAAIVIGVTANVYIKNYYNYHKCEFDSESRLSVVSHVQEDINNMRYAKSYDEIYDYFKLSKVFSDKDMSKGYYDAEIVNEGGIVGEENIMFKEASDDYETFNSNKAESPELTDEYDAGGAASNTDINNNQKNDFTDTYHQESGVLEADKVKTDGKTIFYISGHEIRAAQVNNGKFTKVRTFADDLGYIYEMYIYNDKLIVISDNISENYESPSYDTSDGCYYYENNKTLITIYSKDDYSLIGQYKQDGIYTDVRLREDGYMYLISDDNKNTYDYDLKFSSEETEKYIPSYSINDQEKELSCSDILISKVTPDNGSPCISYINLSAFNLNSDTPYEPSDVKSVAGNAGKVYCSINNLYVTFGWDKTEITRFAINDGQIIPEAGTSVRGIVNDQFSMSEYNGYFRIATTFNTWNLFDISDIDTNNCLYVLDMNLNEIGSISGFGLNESIKSVNYNGDMAYIVTFRQTDPLYAIDLSDPANPKKTDELKVNGYSSYMQNWSEGMLLGFGENGDDEGNLNGLKLTMFDNSNPDNLKIIDSVEIGVLNETTKFAYSYSYALNDRKALLISPEKNIIGIPVMIESMYTDSYNGTSAYEFYSFENNKFKKLGSLNIDISAGYYSEGLQRAVIINDYVYVLSDKIFISADIQSFQQTDTFTFPLSTDNNIAYNSKSSYGGVKETEKTAIID